MLINSNDSICSTWNIFGQFSAFAGAGIAQVWQQDHLQIISLSTRTMEAIGRLSFPDPCPLSLCQAIAPVQYVGYVTGPYPSCTPPCTPLGYKFPLKPCRLFITR